MLIITKVLYKFYILGILLEKMGLLKEALDCYEIAIKLNPIDIYFNNKGL